MTRHVHLSLLMFFLPSLASGCLLPTDVDIPDANCVPSIEDWPTRSEDALPLSRFGQILVRPEDLDADQPFEVEVRDCDENQTLEYQVALNLDPSDPGSATTPLGGVLPPSERRPFSFTLPRQDFGLRVCTRIQLFVSGAFNGLGQARFDPVEEGDLAVATWFLELVEDVNDNVDRSNCLQ